MVMIGKCVNRKDVISLFDCSGNVELGACLALSSESVFYRGLGCWGRNIFELLCDFCDTM